MKAAAGSNIVVNKNAPRNYHLLERYEGGLVLLGTEVKSLRNGNVQMNDAYAVFEKDEAFILNLHISPYSHGNRFNHDPLRKRKILLNKAEIRKLMSSVVEKGFTLIPTRLYWSKGRAKVELALAKGKHKGDRREDLKKRDTNREINLALKRSR